MDWGGIGSVFGSIADLTFGNQQRRQNAAEAHDWSVEDAQTNRGFQERMSNTAHQREVKDLKAAGLNPVLSGTGGAGASTPGGDMANAQMAPYESGFNKIVSNAMEIRNMSAQNALLKAQEKQSNSASGVNDATTGKIKKETDILAPKASFMKTLNEGMQWGAKKLNDFRNSSSKPNNQRIQPSPKLNNKY